MTTDLDIEFVLTVLIANNLLNGAPDALISPRVRQKIMAIDLSLGFEIIMEDNHGWLCRSIATGQEFYASAEDIMELINDPQVQY